MNNMEPVLVSRSTIQQMLGGISRTTFWRKRQEWADAGTPFPEPLTEIGPSKGGALYRYVEVMSFFKAKNFM